MKTGREKEGKRERDRKTLEAEMICFVEALIDSDQETFLCPRQSFEFFFLCFLLLSLHFVLVRQFLSLSPSSLSPVVYNLWSVVFD